MTNLSLPNENHKTSKLYISRTSCAYPPAAAGKTTLFFSRNSFDSLPVGSVGVRNFFRFNFDLKVPGFVHAPISHLSHKNPVYPNQPTL